MTTDAHAQDIKAGRRFTFGDNWKAFLETLDDDRIASAEKSLGQMLGTETLKGQTFLDAGSGSGLSSLAARRMGARVHSFDYDPQSVACTAELKRRYYPDDPDWTVETGSVLDPSYLNSLGVFDVVYSWGVLHHTGDMWSAIDNVAKLSPRNGRLFIAIYNHLGGGTKRWKVIKRVYCGLPSILRVPFAIMVTTPIQLWSLFVHLVQGKVGLYFSHIRNYRRRRGMSWWHDQLDWIGGYPYEDARPEEIFQFLRDRGFNLVNLQTHGGAIGCNQFVFVHSGTE